MDQQQATDVSVLQNNFVVNLKRRSQRQATQKTAQETLDFLRKVIAYEKYDSLADLIGILTQRGDVVSMCDSKEIVIRNLVLMSFKIIREENARIASGNEYEQVQTFDSLNTLWQEKAAEQEERAANIKKLRTGVILALKEVGAEVESSRESVADQAKKIVQLQDVLLVHSLRSSETLQAFLAVAQRTCRHRVLSVAACDELDATYMKNASPVLLSDVSSKMSESTKVILTAAAIFPDGSCLVPAGGLSICLAAKRHSVPVYVLASFYKVCPCFIADGNSFCGKGHLHLPFAEAAQFAGKVEVVRQTLDVIPASLVSLFVSNSAVIVPSHVYRLIETYYDPETVK